MKSDNHPSRTRLWQPPPRPEWVSRINEEGSYMDIRGIVPIDENSLLATAKANTGLDDFGEDDWHEPFQVLVKSLDEEAQLNLMGRLMTRSELLGFLEARLRIEETYKQHPEIEDEEIVKPLLIMGQGRTGTSAMQNLLAEDPDNGTTRTWEVYFPCPPPEKGTYRNDPRIEKADRLVTQYNRVAPEIESMHEFNGWIPAESIHLDCISFFSPSWFNILGQVPSYNAYIAKRGLIPGYRYQKRILKLLQWKNPRINWVLKTPEYINHMPDVLKIYPDACFIWTHRDPIKALASSVNILGTLMWMRSDHPFLGGSWEYATSAEASAASLEKPIEWLESGAVPKDRLCNIRYQDFIKDPVASARRIYDFFGIRRSESSFTAMQTYLDQNPRSSRPTHKYSTGEQELIEQERQYYQRYQQYFKVPDEI